MYRSRMYRSVSVLPEQIPFIDGPRIYCFPYPLTFFRTPDENDELRFAVLTYLLTRAMHVVLLSSPLVPQRRLEL
jgi:hypothetical protein